MKKILAFLLIIIIISFSCNYYYQNQYLPSIKPKLETEKNHATISEYYIYGQHLNMVGIIKKVNANFKDVNLIFWNKKTGQQLKYPIKYKKNITTVKFNISDEMNTSLYLDDIKRGEYNIYLKFSYPKDKKNNKPAKDKYYPLENETSYKTTTYYTTSKYGNKIIINTTKKTMNINIKKSKEKTYDIVLDPACGGIDKGVIANGTNESVVTLAISEKVKEILEERNIKVKLTRTKNSLSENEYFDEYNDGGRAVIGQESHAKYLLSFKVNSSNNTSIRGLGIYTAANINYDFSAKLVENIIAKTNIHTSAVTNYRVDYGLYTHNFTKREIADNMAYYDSKGYKRYNVTQNSNYMYMIRESGGIMTGAYVDDSNSEKVGVNKYYNSNVGVEAYVIELGYLTNPEDFSIITTKKDEYAQAIANTIIEELKH
ncbi:MAG: N-acetylmuramoyl-L-alanine amidase [Bacilli bacterium]|nr:N-acetylmuramoyl-L-alanine amidase [Bacilli bacterium]